MLAVLPAAVRERKVVASTARPVRPRLALIPCNPRPMPGTSGVRGTVTARVGMSSGWFCVVWAAPGGVVPSGQVRRVERTLSVAVRAARRLGGPRARTYSGQRRPSEHHLVAFAQVRWYMEGQAGAYCKPSAQPTLVRTQHLPLPAETAPWLRKRDRRAVFFLSRRVSLRVTVSRYVTLSTDA
jgi:hypothetical protein